MEPIVHGLETEFEADVVFEQLNVTSNRAQLAMKTYDMRGHPSYVLLDAHGTVLWQFSGQISESQLDAQLVSALAALDP